VVTPPVYITSMGTNSTLLCIHRDPTQLSLLEQNGYQLLTATNGAEGLRLFMSRSVDAIVLDYRLGLLDGVGVADEIKRVKPQVPIVMLAEDMELSADALNSVDAFVAKSDGPHFLLATLETILKRKLAQLHEGKLRSHTLLHLRRSGRSRESTAVGNRNSTQLAADERVVPFSPAVWRSIRDGTFKF
jgi:DNA-binding response OmpR family regulator